MNKLIIKQSNIKLNDSANHRFSQSPIEWRLHKIIHLVFCFFASYNFCNSLEHDLRKFNGKERGAAVGLFERDTEIIVSRIRWVEHTIFQHHVTCPHSGNTLHISGFFNTPKVLSSNVSRSLIRSNQGFKAWISSTSSRTSSDQQLLSVVVSLSFKLSKQIVSLSFYAKIVTLKWVIS